MIHQRTHQSAHHNRKQFASQSAATGFVVALFALVTLVVALLLIGLTGCNNSAKYDEFNQDEDGNIVLLFPQGYKSDGTAASDAEIAQLEEKAREVGALGFLEHEDGTLEVTMSRENHDTYLENLMTYLDETYVQMARDLAGAGFLEIHASDKFERIDIVADSELFQRPISQFTGRLIFLPAAYFRMAAGYKDPVVTVTITDPEGNVLDEYTSEEVFENLERNLKQEQAKDAA